METDIPKVVRGFKCIKTKFSAKCTAGHTLFFKEHAVRNPDPSQPAGRTLFVVNVPPYCTESSIKQLFQKAGNVARVTFESKSSKTNEVPDKTSFFSENQCVEGFKVAHVVFKKEKMLKNAMKMDWDSHIFSTEENTLKTGLEKWIESYEHSFVDVESLQKEIDVYIEKYDAKKALEDHEMRMKEGQPDEEGWITVTKHSKHAARTENMEKKVMEKEEKKKKDRKLINFYTFQLRESKMEHLTQLRKKFEEDKKRIAAMRAARKFKPY